LPNRRGTISEIGGALADARAVASTNDGLRAPARHVALIADGNARWARARGVSIAEGHEAAADTLLARLADARELGVEQLSVYAFSTENWSRPAQEIEALIEMLTHRIRRDVTRLVDEGVRLQFIGRREDLTRELAETMRDAEALSRENTGIGLFVAINYGGRAEILDAARRFGGREHREFSELLYAPEMHDPDVIIRTGGERRLSNYLLWQAAYAELVFRDDLWPDFDRQAFEASLGEFATRQRRFGGREVASTAGAGRPERGG
jgi:undecaprenyl diphosphate synthase